MTDAASTRRLIACALGGVLALAGPMGARAQDADGTASEGEVPLRESVYDTAYENQTFEIDPTIPVPPPPAPLEDDPYAPLGVRAGAFIFFPELDARVGHSDNIFSSPTAPTSGTYVRLRPNLDVRSDWVRHELRGRVSADYQSYPDGRGDETTGVDAEITGRIDVRHDTAVELGGGYILTPEGRGDPNVPAQVLHPPDTETVFGTAVLSHTINRLRLSVRGSLDDITYEDVPLIGGGILDNSDRSYLVTRGALRASYDLTGGTAIFAEAGANDRKYDRRIDDNGVIRGSKGYDLLAGLEFDLTGLLAGEVGVGYQRQTPDDPALPDIEGVAFRGALTWQPTGLTTVTLDGAILPEESVLEADASGARVYTAEVTVAHALRRNLILSGAFGWALYDYVGAPREDTYLDVTAGLEYRTSREVALVLEATHSRFDSNVPGEDYEENRVEVGVKVRR